MVDNPIQHLNNWGLVSNPHALQTMHQCSSQSAPLRESRKRLTDGPHQKHSRAIMALSFLGLKMVSVTSNTIIFQKNRIFNLKNNDSVPLYTT